MILLEEEWKYLKKSWPSAPLSTTDRIWTGSGSNLGLHSETLVTDHLSNGTAHFRTKIYVTMFNDSVSTFHLSFITS